MNKLVVVIGLIVLFTIGVVLFSFYQTRTLEKETGIFKEQVQNKEAVTGQPQAILIPAHPEDFGMVVIDENNRPATQQEWDRLISEKVRELKSEATPETWQKIKEKINEDRKKTEDKLKQIDESIKKYKEILKQEPNNKEAREKIERLMMLKSIAGQLP